MLKSMFSRVGSFNPLNFVCLGSVLAFVCVSAQGQLPVVRINNVFPAGGQIGAKVEVAIAGSDLDDATNLLFSVSGISAVPKIKAGGTNIEPNKFIVSIGTNVSVAACELRVIGRYGISNPRRFGISEAPEILKAGGNHSIDSAQKVELGSVVNGICEASAIDYYRIHAQGGRKLLVQAQALEIDSRMAPEILLYDDSGQEVARSRIHGLIEFTPEADRGLIIGIHDHLFRGGPDYVYRLRAGYFPHIDFIEPSFGKAGETNKKMIFGRNLPGGAPSLKKGYDGRPLEVKEMEIAFPKRADSLNSSIILPPESGELDGFDFRVQNEFGFSNPQLLTFAEQNTAALLQESNLIQQVSVPCEIGGIFQPGKNVGVNFSAKKGERYWIELTSQRLGFPSDPFMVVQRITKNDKGDIKINDIQEVSDIDANLGGVEFDTRSHDAHWLFEVKEDGDYRIIARDLFNSSRGKPAYPFELSIKRESPDFRLVVFPMAPPQQNKDAKNFPVWSPFLRKGDYMAVKIVVFGQQNFSQEISLSAEGLPSGLDFQPKTIPAGATSAIIVFATMTNASQFVGPVKLFGTARIGNKTLFHQARAGTNLRAIEDYSKEAVGSRLAQDFCLAVADKELAPVTFEIKQREIETSLAGKVQAPIQIVARTELNNTIKFRMLTGPQKEMDVPSKSTNAVFEIDLTQNKLPVGNHTIELIAYCQGKYGQKGDLQFSAYLPPITLKIAAAPIQLALGMQKAELKKGQKLEVPVQITRLFGCKDPVDINVVLPGGAKGISAAKIAISPDQTSGKLVIEAGKDAPMGEQKLMIQASVKFNNQELKLDQPITLQVAAN